MQWGVRLRARAVALQDDPRADAELQKRQSGATAAMPCQSISQSIAA